ncbi:MAG TPA: heavy metal-associated domain-containing protein [Candidatus Udaeobacter sp.]|jgi:copper chaperone CopZ|nr:heavy metal-associated domain-containing protein [Candidatus Udaeobacter sp.]
MSHDTPAPPSGEPNASVEPPPQGEPPSRHEFWNAAALAAAILVIAVAAPWLIHELRSEPRPVTIAARANQRIVTLEVGGMTCAGCAAKIQSELATVPGVQQVEVRLADRRAIVVCDRRVADAALTAAVQRAGPGYLAAPAQN